MKVRVASVLSLAGVLAAGSAAAVVNTQVLQPSAPAATPNAAADTITTHPLGTGSASPASQASYRVGDAGAVLVDTSGDLLTVVSVTPGESWTVASVSAPGDTIAVTFQQGTNLVTFTASFISGVVATSVDLGQVADTPDTPAGQGGTGQGTGGAGPTTSGPRTTAPRTTVDDDDDDDSDDDDDDGDSDDDD